MSHDLYATKMTPEEIAEVCETTADLLEGKWTRGSWYDQDTGRMCIEGGLLAAFGIDLRDYCADGSDNDVRRALVACPVYAAVTDTVHLKYDHEGELTEWNDYGCDEDDEDDEDDDVRTEQEVLDILRLTAKRVLGGTD